MAAVSEVEWITVEEAARRLSMSADAVYQAIHRGTFPAFKFGRRLRIRASDIAAVMVPRESATTAPRPTASGAPTADNEP
jgi:excisionase family DNA binding protein